MTEFEKLILEQLGELGTKVTRIDERTTRIEERTTGIEERVTGIEERVTGIEERVTGIEERVTGIEERVTRIEITIENDISKKIDIIGEGHDFLKQRLDDALKLEKKRESMELELINLRMEVKKIKEHLDIA